MKINEKALKEQLRSYTGVGGIQQAEMFADNFAALLTEKIDDALSEHHIHIGKEVTHNDGDVKENHVVYDMYLDDDSFIRPTLSTRKKYDDANMLYLFDVGWSMDPSKQIVEWVNHLRKATWTFYDGEHYIQSACDEFNHSTPDGVIAMPSKDFM